DLAKAVRARLAAVAPVGPTAVLDVPIDEDGTHLSLYLDTVADYPGIVQGAVIELGSELMLVTGHDHDQQVTVMRGFAGTAAAHAARTPIVIAPRLALALILDELRAEIESWTPR